MNLAVFMPSSWQNGVWLVLLVLSRTLAASSPEDVVLEPGMQPLDKTGKKVRLFALINATTVVDQSMVEGAMTK